MPVRKQPVLARGQRRRRSNLTAEFRLVVTYTQSEILAQWDHAAQAFEFPMLGNGYTYPLDVRLHAYRDEEHWATVAQRQRHFPEPGGSPCVRRRVLLSGGAPTQHPLEQLAGGRNTVKRIPSICNGGRGGSQGAASKFFILDCALVGSGKTRLLKLAHSPHG